LNFSRIDCNIDYPWLNKYNASQWNIATSDMDLIGTYTLVLVVYFDDLEQNQNIFAEFKIKINPPEYPSNFPPFFNVKVG
jgi:hypothetical protein